ncbi:UDP-N-acetylglucosamine 2-epimerase (non-hydrolyzing) [Desulfobotulus sp. H1]|uniref:UDP-N-acetylglucosamine 2-epimerase (Non-hydrolyzing) n=1 Tax=Desulfobotulus pelophilus TaxID=2823377 RepID=A0ABT3NC67_9BACT|nr:UDP-N-acetylglucosamine 2-epimerase (non-hydrolyzing) [Desulfobotulus pelophilus]MCW7755067.1 UDP-N-acetylglucosamine 2-epimerase (non-hydrolyzing) [Desulfobotulus pelophilus]
MKICIIAGARPNFMKIAPLIREIQRHDTLDFILVHTGQHYDYEMSEAFFKDLEIPRPGYFLNVGSASHAKQTAAIMSAFEDVCLAETPGLVLVVGDVNSTMAASIVAKKLEIKVAHIEAGLRSFDLSMPEEINRMVTDAITDYFFTTEKAADDNLVREGKPLSAIHFVGHVMIDNLLYQKERLGDLPGFLGKEFKEKYPEYFFMTLHRPSNVDDKAVLQGIFDALNEIAEETPFIFPVHPRTRKQLDAFGIRVSERIEQVPPLGFKESLYLWKDAKAVFTDSGGLQEETTGLGVPCFTLRDNTERPVTIEEGTNLLVGSKTEDILKAWQDMKEGRIKKGRIPALWDGRAAERIVDVLFEHKV